MYIYIFFWKSLKKLKKLELSPQNFHYDVLHLLYLAPDQILVFGTGDLWPKWIQTDCIWVQAIPLIIRNLQRFPFPKTSSWSGLFYIWNPEIGMSPSQISNLKASITNETLGHCDLKIWWYVSLIRQMKLQIQKSDNLQYKTLIRWFPGTNDSSTKPLMF